MLNQEREIIRVGTQPTHAGIVASLRRAFTCASMDDTEQEFGELLSRLT